MNHHAKLILLAPCILLCLAEPTQCKHWKLLRTIGSTVQALCITANWQARNFFDNIWGSNPDITLLEKEKKLNACAYPRNIIYQLMRINLVKQNTRKRARTIGIIASIAGSACAYRIWGSIKDNRSAIRLVLTGIGSGLFSWLLGTRIINFRKRSILEQRTSILLENTPDFYLIKEELSMKPPIEFDNLGDIMTAKSFLAHIDEPTLDRMYKYWQEKSIPYDQYSKMSKVT